MVKLHRKYVKFKRDTECEALILSNEMVTFGSCPNFSHLYNT